MNEIFSFKRFGLLLKEQIYKNLKLFIIGTIVIFAVLCAINMIMILSLNDSNNFFIKQHEIRLFYYAILLFPTGLLLSGFFFTNIQKSSPDIGNLLLPASHFEKICIAFIINVLLFSVTYLIIIISVELVMFRDIILLKYILNLKSNYSFYLSFYALQSTFLFGSLLFKKLAPIKMGFVLFVIFLILQFTHLIVLKFHFANQDVKYWGDFLSENSYIKVSSFYKIFMNTLLYATFPIFWIASYYKLKEKQV
jgi:hypothetical protein